MLDHFRHTWDWLKMNPVEARLADVPTSWPAAPRIRHVGLTSSCHGTGGGTPPLAARRPNLAAIAAVSTIGYVGNMRGENEDWLYDLSIECLQQIIADDRAPGNAPPQVKSAK
jgi:hypothetical protein